jgi:hypothetical protein
MLAANVPAWPDVGLVHEAAKYYGPSGPSWFLVWIQERPERAAGTHYASECHVVLQDCHLGLAGSLTALPGNEEHHQRPSGLAIVCLHSFRFVPNSVHSCTIGSRRFNGTNPGRRRTRVGGQTGRRITVVKVHRPSVHGGRTVGTVRHARARPGTSKHDSSSRATRSSARRRSRVGRIRQPRP